MKAKKQTQGETLKRIAQLLDAGLCASEACGYCFALDAARNGYRFKPRENPGRDKPPIN